MNGSHLLTLDNTKRYNKPPLFMKWPGSQLAIKSAKYTLSRRQYRRRQWHPTPVLLPGKSHGQRSLVGYSPWGHKESDTTERLHYSHYKVNFTILGDSFKRIKDHIYLPLIPDYLGFPDSSVGKESACSAVDPSSIPGSGRSAGEG